MNTAEAAVESHAEAINQRDVETYLASTNFPFTYQNYNGVALTKKAVGESNWDWDSESWIP